MSLPELAILGLAVWRLSSLLTRERGPGNLFVRLRQRAGIEPDPDSGEPNVIPDGFWPELLSCPWCVSLWLGAAAAAGWALAPRVTWWACLPLALSAVTVLVETQMRRS